VLPPGKASPADNPTDAAEVTPCAVAALLNNASKAKTPSERANEFKWLYLCEWSRERRPTQLGFH